MPISSSLYPVLTLQRLSIYTYSIQRVYTYLRVGIEGRGLNTKYICHLPSWCLVGGGRCVDEKKAEWGKNHGEHNHQGMGVLGRAYARTLREDLDPSLNWKKASEMQEGD